MLQKVRRCRSGQYSTVTCCPAGEVGFELLGQGIYCEDGIDIMEGAVDSYTDCTDRGPCLMTQKCRAKCRKRKHCQFYTSFQNGWCQLSTRCGKMAKGGDPMARTFKKVLKPTP